LLLIFFILFLIVHGYQNNYGFLASLFVIITVISFLTESSLRTQNGVIFVCFFSGFLVTNFKSESA
jgi:hypothetical protein